jgi:transposase
VKIKLDGLPEDPALLRQLVEQLVVLVEKQSRDIDRQRQTIEKLQRLQFGSKSEKLDPQQQLLGFEPAAAVVATPVAAPEASEATDDSSAAVEGEDSPKKANKGHGRRRVPKTLQRLTLEYTLAPEERMCSCGQICERIGDESSEQLDWVPSSLVVLEHIRVKYACQLCEGKMAIAPVPDQVIEKGLAGTGLLSYVLTSKYSDHLPLHRLESIFKRHGYPIPRSTMCGWVAVCADLLVPIVTRMWELVMKSWVLHTDDTTVPIQDPELERVRKGRLWTYYGDIEHPFILYEYTPDHTEQHPIARLSAYRGHIQADGYAAYTKICEQKVDDQVVRHLVACWAHARRYFFDAQTNDRVRAMTALAYIQKLYKIEKAAKEQSLTVEARHALRQKEALPILKNFKTWLDEQWPRVLPSEGIGEAIGYTLRRWTELERYTTDGRLKIDNNLAENAMRNIAIGRKNWLFAQSDEGGRRAAIIYSIVETCKRNGINVYEYLRDVLDRVSTHPANAVDELLPAPGRWTRTSVPATERGRPAGSA